MSRFIRYAPFVRILQISHPPAIDEGVFSQLQSAGIRSPLLPALQELTFTHHWGFTPTAARWIIGPCTHTVSVNLTLQMLRHGLPPLTDDGPRDINVFLRDLRTLSPRLRKLSLEGRDLKGEPYDVKPLLSLSDLHELRCDILCSTDFLRSLATFPCLRTLILGCVAGPPRPAPGGFARLERLEIHGGIEQNTHALKTIMPPRLRALSTSSYARFWDQDPTNMARQNEALTSIVRRCSRTLCDVHVDIKGDFERMGLAPYHSMTRVWEPFLHAKNLWSFRLRVSDLPLPFPDTDLFALAGHWPRLRTLHIHSFREGPQLPTVRGIADFADACPSLREIGISYVNWPTALENTGPSFTAANNVALLTLGCGDTGRNARGADHKVVARYLNYRFPSLDIQGSKKLIPSLYSPKTEETHPHGLHDAPEEGRFWGEILDSAEIQRFGARARESGLWLPLKRRSSL